LLPRSGTLLAVGGGTIGDLATVAAHLLKRGVRLIHVPTTLLAAVDSSLGGKGAVHVDGVKNAAGVFHYAEQTWLCPSFFETLSEKQRREGRIEALKMAACLSPELWRSPPRDDVALTKAARRMKERVCAKDPYDLDGTRAVLNFGHTFGHVIETRSDFRISHGDAVGLGMLCALDIGRLMEITTAELAQRVEARLPVLPRTRLRSLFRSEAEVARLLRSDKKSDGTLKMILLERIGRARLVRVPDSLWRQAFSSWREGMKP
ncbi:MAG: 3-dehydroquinate synthase family protein, partial [Myxococcaceae bacterium]